MSRCERCGRETNVTTMSWFNTKTICADGDDSCSAREERSPGIEEAKRVETAAVQAGNYNFQGIGWNRRHG
jgi:hypothetical protein